MRRCATLCLFFGLATVCGCSRQQTANCESAARYSTASSAQPVQIPDDLSPPNESDALRLPPDVAASTAEPSAGCLESPPSFSRDSRLGRGSTESNDESQTPADAAGPAAAGERVIEN
jgi:hypothetical protein